MSPTLEPGDELVGSSSLDPVVGAIVAFPDPDRPERWLIKRLTDEVGNVGSDNIGDSSRDSRDFGPVDLGTAFTQVTRLDEVRFAEGASLLADEDEAISAIVDRWGIPEFWARRPGFETLVLLILEQQVSLESGAAMYRKLKELLGDVNPQTILDLGPARMRDIGVTRQKASYLTGLSNAIVSGELDLRVLEDETADVARRALTDLKGIGPWTADAYLLSASRRPDMWPVGDRALQVGAGEAVGMQSPATESELEILGEAWRPIRAVAARLIWHNYLCERGRVEPPDPTL